MRLALEVAEIFRRHGPAYAQAHDGRLGRVERRVMSAIELCRTSALGGHVEGCRGCGTVHVAYNSCRNRHCPKCQGAAARDWLTARADDLLPVPYFHVVFTLPAEIAAVDAGEFIRRFLLHTLPDGVHRIRHYVSRGHLAHRLEHPDSAAIQNRQCRPRKARPVP